MQRKRVTTFVWLCTFIAFLMLSKSKQLKGRNSRKNGKICVAIVKVSGLQTIRMLSDYALLYYPRCIGLHTESAYETNISIHIIVRELYMEKRKTNCNAMECSGMRMNEKRYRF